MSHSSQQGGPIHWMAHNPVAANFLLLLVLLLGLQSAITLRKEVFPSIPTETIRITVPYPGSSPEEVEEGIVLKVEEAVQDLEDVKEITSEARESVALINVVLEPGSDVATALNKITVRINGIASFPAEAEEPIVEEVLALDRVMNLSIYGGLDEAQLKALADSTRDDLLTLGGITQVEIIGTRDYEIAIEVSDHKLREYGLSFAGIVEAVRNRSSNLPGGALRTDSGTITLRSQGQAYNGSEFADIVLLTAADGTRLRLSDIADVKDGFEEQPVLNRFNGEAAVRLIVYSIGDQNSLAIEEKVSRYVQAQQGELPASVKMETWAERTDILKGRINLLLKNALQGGLLVLITLALFLRLSVAIWVVVGVPFAFLGAMWVMSWPAIDVSINVISVFGFLLVLGIVVDDAIVTGEAAWHALQQDQGKAGIPKVDSVVRGVREVSVATIFGILTTVIAFMPMLTIESGMGRIMGHMAWVVIAALIFSLIETKLILPAHLTHVDPVNKPNRASWLKRMDKTQDWFAARLDYVASHWYRPILNRALEHRYTTLSLFIASFILLISLVPAGVVKFVFFPNIASDEINISMEMPAGSSHSLTHRYAIQIEQAAERVSERYQKVTGKDFDPIASIETRSDTDTTAVITASLQPSEKRSVDSVQLSNWWREAIGPMPGIKSMSFDANAGPSGSDIDVQLSSDDLDRLRDAAADLRTALAAYPGVNDVTDTFGTGAPEMDIRITPAGQALGLGQVELARQVRQAFFGAEVQRVQRGRHEMRVYVRLPQETRDSIYALESLWLTLPDGREVPFSVVAEMVPGVGLSTIRHEDRQRVVNIRATVNKTQVEPDAIRERLAATALPELLEKYPGLTWHWSGISQDQDEDIRTLYISASMVLIMIYAALAIPLKSYTQPIYIMSAIPFSVMGAIVGHYLMGKSLSMFSVFGMVALIGVVVNDSLVLVDHINQRIRAGGERLRVVKEAGERRFRAVILTSATTFLGLLPIQLETSIQSEFVKPMAISVGFGVLFATVITLILVPCLLYIREDFRRGKRGKQAA